MRAVNGKTASFLLFKDHEMNGSKSHNSCIGRWLEG